MRLPSPVRRGRQNARNGQPQPRHTRALGGHAPHAHAGQSASDRTPAHVHCDDRHASGTAGPRRYLYQQERERERERERGRRAASCRRSAYPRRPVGVRSNEPARPLRCPARQRGGWSTALFISAREREREREREAGGKLRIAGSVYWIFFYVKRFQYFVNTPARRELPCATAHMPTAARPEARYQPNIPRLRTDSH